MGCCVGRKKVDPLALFGNDIRKENSVVRSSQSRIPIPPKSEKVRVHKSIDVTYKIYSSIGKGSFGHVIRVEHNATKKPYAMKIIDLSRDLEHGKKSEIEILRTVNHKYVIKLHEVISAPGKLYLVMDLATGGELFDRIYQLGNFDEDQASRVLSMILKGIKYLHSVGITHRDLKPENILYYHPGENSRIIITDFGLATIRKSENALMNTDCGTVEYMAPEVITKDPYTNSVDMWSTGVITYVLLSGKMPFSLKGDPINRVLKRICFGTYSYIGKPWDSVSQEAKSLIDSLLIVESSNRLTASEALEHHWIKQAQHNKVNLQKSISSNWTESCLSLKSAASKTSKKSTKLDQNTEHVKLRNAKGTDRTTSHTTDCSWGSKACGASKRCLQSTHQRRDYKTISGNVAGRHIPTDVVRTQETIDNPEDAIPFTSCSLASRNKHCEGTGNERTSLKKQSETLRSGIVELPPLKTPFTPSTWNEAHMFRG